MSTAPQRDYISRHESDKLDKELDKIFEEMEDAVKKAGISPDGSSPHLDFIIDDMPDDYDAKNNYPSPQVSSTSKETTKLPPMQLETIQLPNVSIAPKDTGGTQMLSINLAVKSANLHSDLNLETANTCQPSTHAFSTSKHPQESPMAIDPPTIREHDGNFTTTLTPEQLSQLIEQTVERAIISAFKKYGSTS